MTAKASELKILEKCTQCENQCKIYAVKGGSVSHCIKFKTKKKGGNNSDKDGR